MDDLEERVELFNMMELPGQPRIMHIGTQYLVNDLWKEIKRLRSENELSNANNLTLKEKVDLERGKSWEDLARYDDK